MDDAPPQNDQSPTGPEQINQVLSSLSSKIAEIDQLKEACLQAKVVAEAARDAATQAKAKAEAEAAQVAKTASAAETARTTAEQERDKIVAAGATTATFLTSIDEQKAKIAAAVVAAEIEQKKTLEASNAATLASGVAEKSKSAAESAKLEAEAQRAQAVESAKAANDAKTQIDATHGTITKRAAQIDAAKEAASAAQVSAEAASTAAAAARQSGDTELEKTKKARADAEAGQKIVSQLGTEVAKLKDAAEKHRAQAQAAEKAATDSSSAASQRASSAAEALNLSTSVTLAGAFNKKASKNTWREWIWAVALLVSLVGILVMGIWRYEGLSEAISKTTDTKTLLAEILLAFFGVSGPVWLAWMSTRMLGRTFALVEDYSYKAALAQAYVGFREEAKDLDPILQERLFAAAITQLDANPVRLLNAEHPGSPLQDLLQQPFIQGALENPTFKEAMTAWMRGYFRARVVTLPKVEGMLPLPKDEGMVPPNAAVLAPIVKA